MYTREECLEDYKSILRTSKCNWVISVDYIGMGHLLSLNGETPYQLVVITRKLLTKLWARREYILVNRNEGRGSFKKLGC